jgi:hypothetical protein
MRNRVCGPRIQRGMGEVSALQGQVMTVAAAIVFLVAVIGKATVWPKANIWPYEIPLILAGSVGLVGWAIYRDRGDGDDADAEQAEPRVPVRAVIRPRCPGTRSSTAWRRPGERGPRPGP